MNRSLRKLLWMVVVLGIVALLFWWGKDSMYNALLELHHIRR